MTPFTDAGRAHLAAIAAERAEKRDTMIAERRAQGLADLDVGSYVWARQEVEDGPIRGGLVVDADDHGLIVLDSTMRAHGWVVEARRVGSSRGAGRMLVAVRRIAHEAVEVAEPRSGRALAEYAKAAWLAAGVGPGEVTVAERDLARYGDWLAQLAVGGRLP